MTPADVYQLRDDYLEQLTLRPASARAYRSDINHFLNWCNATGKHPLDVDHTGLREYRTHLSTTPSPRSRRLRSAGTVDRMLYTISAWYQRHLSALRPAGDNPARGLTRSASQRTSRPSAAPQPSAADKASLCELAHSAAPSYWPPRCAELAMRLVLDVGARYAEIIAAQIADIEHHTLDDKPLVQLRTHGDRPRLLDLPPHVVTLVAAWLRDRHAPSDQQALLVDTNGRPFQYRQLVYLRKRLDQALARARQAAAPDTASPG